MAIYWDGDIKVVRNDKKKRWEKTKQWPKSKSNKRLFEKEKLFVCLCWNQQRKKWPNVRRNQHEVKQKKVWEKRTEENYNDSKRTDKVKL